MYHGEVNIAQEDLTSFLAAAQDLKVKGQHIIYQLNDVKMSPWCWNRFEQGEILLDTLYVYSILIANCEDFEVLIKGSRQ